MRNNPINDKIVSKKLLFVLPLLILCLFLASCAKFPMRLGSKAYRINENRIELNGKHYIKLPPIDALQPNIMGDIDNPWLYNKDGTKFECAISISEDKSFLNVAEYEGENNEERVEYLYCISDLYDEIVPVIRDGYTPDKYYYTVYTVKDNRQTATKYTLSEEEISAVNAILSDIEPFTDTNYRALFFIDSSYKEPLFGMPSDIMVAEYKGETVIVDYDGGVKHKIHLIPDEYRSTIDDLVTKREEQKNAH